MARRDDREYRAIFEGATQPAAGVPAARFPARWGGAGMPRRPNGVPSAAAALGAPNAAGLSPRAAWVAFVSAQQLLVDGAQRRRRVVLVTVLVLVGDDHRDGFNEADDSKRGIRL